uniref:FkbM family methyltransferase n=1 Tax=Natrinema zhouii TaxID=1710539 RepID=A0A7D6CPG9_9EURY
MKLTNKSLSYLTRKVLEEYYNVRYTAIGKPVLPMQTPAGEIKFEVDPEWPRLASIASGGVYEPILLQSLYNRLDRDSILYNVGARWGCISIFAEKCGLPKHQIHSFEANAKSAEILERNLAEHRYITNAFVSDSSGGNQIVLDTYADTHDSPTVVKIDVEGAEMAVIQGALNLIATEKPELFIEVHPEYLQEMGSTQNELIDELEKHDYELTMVDHRSDRNGWQNIDKAKLPSTGDYLLRAV